MHMVADQNRFGYESSSQEYFYNLNHNSKIEYEAAKRSTISEARSKLSYKAFEYLLNSINLNQKSEISDSHLWHGHLVRAVDGTKLTLPATKEILKEFPRRGNRGGSVEHYPFAILTTAVNVFTGQPNAVRMGNKNSSEPQHLVSMLDEFERGDIVLLDRGLGGGNVWLELAERGQFFVNRVKSKESGTGSSESVTRFLKSNKKQLIIKKLVKDGESKKTLLVRLIRGRRLKCGGVLVIATNLLDKKLYPAKEVLKLYSSRWKVETHYGRAKTLLQLSKFHGRDLNKVKQEIFANLLILSITSLAILEVENKVEKISKKRKCSSTPNFKNAVNVVKRNFLYILGSPTMTAKASAFMAKKMINQIQNVRCAIQPNRSYPRYSRQAVNRWAYAKKNKIEQFSRSGRVAH